MQDCIQQKEDQQDHQRSYSCKEVQQQLYIVGVLAKKIQQTIFQKTGFTISIGILVWY